MDIEKYLSVPYLDGGRTMEGLDCYGLLMCIRSDMGLKPPPDVGQVTRHDVIGMQHKHANAVLSLSSGEPIAGGIAAVFRGKAVVHVGAVVEIDGRLSVIETNPKSGVRWLRVRAFEDQYAKVVYYFDRDIPEPS